MIFILEYPGKLLEFGFRFSVGTLCLVMTLSMCNRYIKVPDLSEVWCCGEVTECVGRREQRKGCSSKH